MGAASPVAASPAPQESPTPIAQTVGAQALRGLPQPIAAAFTDRPFLIAVNVEIVQMESAALSAELAKSVDQSETQMVVSNWSPSKGDADWGPRLLYTKGQWPPAGATYSFDTNPRVEEYVQQGLQFTDETKRKEAYAKVQELIWEDAPNIFLYTPTSFGGIRTEAGGVLIRPDGIIYMRTAHYKA